MIFHISADPFYIEKFYHNFVDSIKKYSKNSLISLNVVGELDKYPTVDIFNQEKITKQEIEQRYKTNGRDTLGYYCLSRWASIPLVDNHVCVCDIDIVAVNYLDLRYIELLIEEYKVVNLTRIKPKTKDEGGMMVIFLHKDICKEIRDYANSLLVQDEQLEWKTDVKVREYLYERFSVKNLLKMQEISKSGSIKIQDPWFIFSKIGKFQNLL